MINKKMSQEEYDKLIDDTRRQEVETDTTSEILRKIESVPNPHEYLEENPGVSATELYRLKSKYAQYLSKNRQTGLNTYEISHMRRIRGLIDMYESYFANKKKGKGGVSNELPKM